MRIRPATAADLPAIGQLFNALIATTTVAWRDHPAGTDELRTWFAHQQDAGNPVLVADVDSDNAESIAFHHAMGFSEVAQMREVGRKFDRWLDLVLMQRILT
jgi:L-amino acid N-acyltransferase YncA